MKIPSAIIVTGLVSLVLFSCGTDTRELAAETKKTGEPVNTMANAADTAIGFFEVLDQVPELKSGFKTKTFDQNGTYTQLDTSFVREYVFVPKGYVFDMPESWQAVGKMYLPGYILVVVNYSNPGANNLDLFVFDPQGTPLTNLALAIHMPPSGTEVPAEATINAQGLISVVYKAGTRAVKKDFVVQDNEIKLVKMIQLP